MVELPNVYSPIGHVLTRIAEHAAPGGQIMAAAMLGVPHTEPTGHERAAALPAGQN